MDQRDARRSRPSHVLDLIGAAGTFPHVADRFAGGFNDPADFEHCFFDPQKAAAYLAKAAE